LVLGCLLAGSLYMYQLQHKTGKIANVQQHYICTLTVVNCFVRATELVLATETIYAVTTYSWGHLSSDSICPKLNGSNYPKVSFWRKMLMWEYTLNIGFPFNMQL